MWAANSVEVGVRNGMARVFIEFRISLYGTVVYIRLRLAIISKKGFMAGQNYSDVQSEYSETVKAVVSCL